MIVVVEKFGYLVNVVDWVFVMQVGFDCVGVFFDENVDFDVVDGMCVIDEFFGVFDVGVGFLENVVR